MKEFNKMINGLYYSPRNSEEILKHKLNARKFMDDFNNTKYHEFDIREKLIRGLFKKVGKNIRVNKPFHVDYGINIELGNNFYANFGTVILDVCSVIIGDNVLFAPNVSVFSATHPVDIDARLEGYEYCKPVVIGNNVWIGGNSVINPGVTIGDNTVIGSGSVVTKNIPANVVAAGNPCRVIRKINEEDEVNHINKLNELNEI